MDDKTALDIALFRFSVIGSVLYLDSRSRLDHFQEMAERDLLVPHYGTRRYSEETFRKWLRRYRSRGLDGLKPQIRCDKGRIRVITPELAQTIVDKRHLYPRLSGAAFHKLLTSEGFFDPRSVSEPTFRNFLNARGLLRMGDEPQARKKFEHAHINELWVADFMHGPHFLIEGRKRPVFLCAILDDHSRVVVGGRFFLHENASALDSTLKQALLTYGICKRFYADNGAPFVTRHLQLVCALLHIALIHSKPYDSPSRGKIERFMRTVRERFLALLSPRDVTHLDDLTTRFAAWLDKEYHHHHHHGIDTRPMDRWMSDIKDTEVRRISERDLDEAFLHHLSRKVKKDSTVSIDGVLYEVPPRYIGETIEIRFTTDKPQDLHLYENGKAAGLVRPVNPNENARSPLSGIRFSRPKPQGDPS